MAQSQIVDNFISKLNEAEKRGDAKAVSELFAPEAKLVNLTRHNTQSRGRHEETACHFWSQYLSAFQRVQSQFENVTETGNTAVLEWTASGVLHMGIPITYVGVTIFEHDGEFIQNLRTYYDSAAFMPHAPTNEKTHSASVGRPEITIEASS